MRRGIIVFAVTCACAGERANTVTLEREPNKPVATVDASLLPPSEHARPSGNACVMLFECGCNAGCTTIDQPQSALRVGMQVGVTSGPLKGTSVFVAKNATDSGEQVFTIQRADPKAQVHVCAGLLRSSSTLGYLCAVKDSGNARACQTCE